MQRTNLFKNPTLLNRELTKKQQAYINCLIPVLITATVYILHFSADFCLVLQHYRDENFNYSLLTGLFLFAPVISSLLFTLSNVEIWPDVEFGCVNAKWLFLKLMQHLFFPVWAMYRFAEQLFWSIEAVKNNNDEEIEKYLNCAQRNSGFELYQFFQAYLQATPQILLQLHFIFRQNSNFNKITVDMQLFSILMSLIKMSLITSNYQRFKSQKLAGKQYPWYKKDTLSDKNASFRYIDLEKEEFKSSETEVDQHTRRNSGLSETSSQFDTQIVQNVQNQRVILPVKTVSRNNGLAGLPEDDAAGKLVSYLCWFSFILPRMLALSAFAYFFQQKVIWLCFTHYLITLTFLLYDATISDLPYYRAVFILFIAYIYIFCLIEFKVKFKKVAFIYNGYFILTYLENFIMTFIWYHSEEFTSDWWYKYIYYLIFGSSVLSASSMLFYIFILKPKKIINRGL